MFGRLGLGWMWVSFDMKVHDRHNSMMRDRIAISNDTPGHNQASNQPCLRPSCRSVNKLATTTRPLHESYLSTMSPYSYQA